MKKFANRLKELRAEKNLSLLKLSKEVGLSISCLSRWENCQADIHLSQLKILANFFGVTLDYMAGIED